MIGLTTRAAIFLSLALLMTGCSGGSSANLAEIVEQGKMVIDYGGTNLPLRVAAMDIFLVDPDYEDQYPERFWINGPDVDLVGEFPRDLRVGYGADYSQLVGKTVAIAPAAEVEYERRSSAIKSLGIAGDVMGGSLVVGKVLGLNPDGAGQVLEGHITLQLDDRTVEGRFTLLAVTWG